MSGFEYLIQIAPNIHRALSDAGELACTKPNPSATESRRALELAVNFWHEASGLPLPASLSEGLVSPEFCRSFDTVFRNHCHTVRQVGNAAAHSNEVIHDDFALKLFETTVGLVKVLVPDMRADEAEPPEPDDHCQEHHGGVIPSWADLERMGITLTPGHRHLVEYLEEHWPDWGVYVEPHTYGYKPDVVAVHPSRGVAIFEVKDYSLDCYRYGDDTFEVRGADGSWHRTLCPLAQLERVRTAMGNGVLSGLLPGVCQCVLYVRGPAHTDVVQLFGTRSGATRLVAQDSLHPVLNQLSFTSAGEDFASRFPEIRAILVPSEHRLGNWSRTELRPKQRAAAMTRWDRDYDVNALELAEQGDLFGEGTPSAQVKDPTKRWFRRFRAPAGAGKSFVLGSRAASACAHDKKTLVCCFNITLTNYLYEIVSNRAPKDKRSHFVCRHFHSLIADMEVGLGLRAARKKRRKETEGEIQDSCQPLNAARMHELQAILSGDWTFDAIYVDEAQDFHVEWLEFLVSLLRPGGEMVIAADFKQNIYNSAGASEATPRLPFRGRWRQISDVSERIPGNLVPWLNKFATDHEIGDPEDLPMVPRQTSFEFASMTRWKNFESETSALSEVCKLVQWLKTKHSKSPEAIALLVPTHQLGSALVNALSTTFGTESVDDVFGDTHRKKKRRMYMSGGRLKASTIHSFKGWDIETVILLWQAGRTSQDNQKALLYAGITRAKVNIFVFNLDPELNHFADEFPNTGKAVSIET